MSKVTAALRAYPTLLKVGFAAAVAYRAEMIVWVLTTTMPLVNLALWSAVASAGGPIGGYGTPELIAYFLAALIVRQLTGSWVVWEMNQELRSGTLSMRLLRPIHPLLAYSAENLAALPLRSLFCVPVAILALVFAGAGHFSHRADIWAIALGSITGAWLITFLCMALVGTLGFFTESSVALFDIYLAGFFVLSGYVFPLGFLATTPRLAAVLHHLPFYYQLGFPIELILGQHELGPALRGLAVQWAYVAALLTLVLLVWKAGVRRWNAYGA